MRSLEEMAHIIARFMACSGPLVAKDAATGIETRVRGIEDRTKLSPDIAVLFEDGTERAFKEFNYGCGGIGSYMYFVLQVPNVEGCEPTALEIWDRGMDDYYPPDGAGAYSPTHAITIVNEGAEAKNAPIIAAWKAEQARLERRRAAEASAERARRVDGRLDRERRAAAAQKAALAPGVRDVRVACAEGIGIRHLELELADGRRIRIAADLDRCRQGAIVVTEFDRERRGKIISDV